MYFTQMLGIAFGIDPKKLGFGKELVAGHAGVEEQAQRTTGGLVVSYQWSVVSYQFRQLHTEN